MINQDKTPLDKHLTVEEISEAERCMRSGKKRDSIEVLFLYKLFPPLLEMLEEAYRPISLMCYDMEIHCKA